MTHTSTEQAEALRDGEFSLHQERAATEAELRSLHARVQELTEQLRKEVQHSAGLRHALEQAEDNIKYLKQPMVGE